MSEETFASRCFNSFRRLFVYSLSTGEVSHYSADSLPPEKIKAIYRDSSDEIWFEQDVVGEVAHFNPYTRKLKCEKVYAEPTNTDRSRPAFHIHEDIFGMLWVHPYGGGFSYFDRKNNCLRPFYNSMTGENWRFPTRYILPSPTVRAICGCVPIPRGWKR